jgi:hypothetical protein
MDPRSSVVAREILQSCHSHTKGHHLLLGHRAPTPERMHVTLQHPRQPIRLSGAHIKRKLKSIFQHMVMHFLLADEAFKFLRQSRLIMGHWP